MSIALTAAATIRRCRRRRRRCCHQPCVHRAPCHRRPPCPRRHCGLRRGIVICRPAGRATIIACGIGAGERAAGAHGVGHRAHECSMLHWECDACMHAAHACKRCCCTSAMAAGRQAGSAVQIHACVCVRCRQCKCQAGRQAGRQAASKHAPPYTFMRRAVQMPHSLSLTLVGLLLMTRWLWCCAQASTPSTSFVVIPRARHQGPRLASAASW